MVRIRVKLGAAEAEVEADPEHLTEAIDLIPELIKRLPSAGSQRPEQPTAQRAPETGEPVQSAVPASIPSITVEKSDSLADIIAKFFADPWGRDRRKLSDVRVALQSYGLNYPKQSVAVALLRLAKNSKIRRFKAEDGEYVYTTSTAFFTPAAEII